MGIHGLTGFIDNNQHLLHQHELHNCPVVLDGNNFYHFLYYVCNVQCSFGGDYNVYRRKIISTLESFKICGITPYFVMDGAYTVDGRKLKTSLSRASARIRLVDVMANNQRGQALPILAYETFIQTLNELGICHATCQFEADNEIAVLANKLRCAVISNDSDFYIFDLNSGFLPMDYLDFTPLKRQNPDGTTLNYLHCYKYQIDDFINSFDGLSRSVLPVFASLLGNDFIDSSAFSTFYSRVKVPKIVSRKFSCPPRLSKVISVLHWLHTQNESTEFWQIKDELLTFIKPERRKIIEKMFVSSVNGYVDVENFQGFDLHSYITLGPDKSQLETVADFRGYNGKTFPSWFVKAVCCGEITPAILNCAILHRVIILTQVEDLAQESSFLCSLGLRRVLYGMLLQGDQPESFCASQGGARQNTNGSCFKCQQGEAVETGEISQLRHNQKLGAVGSVNAVSMDARVDEVKGEVIVIDEVKDEITSIDDMRGEITGIDKVKGEVMVIDAVKGGVQITDEVEDEVIDACKVRGEVMVTGEVKSGVIEINDEVKGIIDIDEVKGEVIDADKVKCVMVNTDGGEVDVIDTDEVKGAMVDTDCAKVDIHGNAVKELKTKVASMKQSSVEEYTRVNKNLLKNFVEPLYQVGDVRIPSLAELAEMSQKDRKLVLFQSLGVDEKFMSCFSKDLQLFVGCLVVWSRNARPKLSLGHLKTVLIGVILLQVLLSLRKDEAEDCGERKAGCVNRHAGDVSKRKPDCLNKDDTEDFSKRKADGVNQDDSEFISQRKAEYVNKNDTENISKRKVNGVNKGNAKDISNTKSDYLKKGEELERRGEEIVNESYISRENKFELRGKDDGYQYLPDGKGCLDVKDRKSLDLFKVRSSSSCKQVEHRELKQMRESVNNRSSVYLQNEVDINRACLETDFSVLETIRQNLHKYHTKSPSFNHNNRYNPKVSHLFAQLQACMADAINLNKVICCPVPNIRPAKLINGTFLYNFYVELSSRPQPDLFIASMLGRDSVLLSMLERIMDLVLEVVGSECFILPTAITKNSRKRKSKATKKGGKGLKDHVDENCRDDVETSVSTISGFDVANKFSLLHVED